MKLIPIADLSKPRVKQFLWEMLEQREPHVNISHRSMPKRQEHDRFVDANLYRGWFIISQDEVWIGNCYITHSYEIGIHLLPAHQNKNYGTQAVQLLMEKYGPARFLANIAPRNIGSQDFFRKLGFKCIQYTFEMET